MCEESVLDVLQKWPRSVPLDGRGQVWAAELDEAVVVLACPNFPSARDVQLRDASDGKECLLRSCPNGALNSFVTSLGSSSRQREADWPSSRLLTVLRQLQAIGWEKVKEVSAEWDHITLVSVEQEESSDMTLIDEDIILKEESPSQVEFLLDLRIPERFPLEGPMVDGCDLPETLTFEWSAKTSTLADVFQRFEERVEAFRPVRRLLQEIDERTWVLDPEKPTHRDLFRRVLVAPGVSLQLSLEASSTALGQLPHIVFLGEDKQVATLRDRLKDNLALFDPNEGLVWNLERLLELSFPARDEVSSRREDFRVDCSICYAHRLPDGDLPSKVCGYTACSRAFHQGCLVDWLRATPDYKISFGVIFGKCPFCEQAITCKSGT